MTGEEKSWLGDGVGEVVWACEEKGWMGDEGGKELAMAGEEETWMGEDGGELAVVGEENGWMGDVGGKGGEGEKSPKQSPVWRWCRGQFINRYETKPLTLKDTAQVFLN